MAGLGGEGGVVHHGVGADGEQDDRSGLDKASEVAHDASDAGGVRGSGGAVIALVSLPGEPIEGKAEGAHEEIACAEVFRASAETGIDEGSVGGGVSGAFHELGPVKVDEEQIGGHQAEGEVAKGALDEIGDADGDLPSEIGERHGDGEEGGHDGCESKVDFSEADGDHDGGKSAVVLEEASAYGRGTMPKLMMPEKKHMIPAKTRNRRL